MGSLLNPLHGGDIENAAKVLGEGQFEEEDAEEESPFGSQRFKRIFFVSCLILAPYVCLSGLYSLFLPEEHFAAQTLEDDEEFILSQSQRSLSIFARFFCSGARRSTYCY